MNADGAFHLGQLRGAGLRPAVTLFGPRAQVNVDGVFRYASSCWFASALAQLAGAGVHGVAVDVWVRPAPPARPDPAPPLPAPPPEA